MMAATAAFTSVACSRFSREQSFEAVLEIGISGLEPRGHGKARLRTAGLVARMLEALSACVQAGPRSLSSASMHSTLSWIEASPEKVSVTLPAGASVRLEMHREQRQHSFLGARPYVPELRAEHAVESERGAAALIVLAVLPCAVLPVETIEHGGKALLRG